MLLISKSQIQTGRPIYHSMAFGCTEIRKFQLCIKNYQWPQTSVQFTQYIATCMNPFQSHLKLADPSSWISSTLD